MFLLITYYVTSRPTVSFESSYHIHKFIRAVVVTEVAQGVIIQVAWINAMFKQWYAALEESGIRLHFVHHTIATLPSLILCVQVCIQGTGIVGHRIEKEVSSSNYSQAVCVCVCVWVWAGRGNRAYIIEVSLGEPHIS